MFKHKEEKTMLHFYSQNIELSNVTFQDASVFFQNISFQNAKNKTKHTSRMLANKRQELKITGKL